MKTKAIINYGVLIIAWMAGAAIIDCTIQPIPIPHEATDLGGPFAQGNTGSSSKEKNATGSTERSGGGSGYSNEPGMNTSGGSSSSGSSSSGGSSGGMEPFRDAGSPLEAPMPDAQSSNDKNPADGGAAPDDAKGTLPSRDASGTDGTATDGAQNNDGPSDAGAPDALGGDCQIFPPAPILPIAPYLNNGLASSVTVTAPKKTIRDHGIQNK
jgi:hypothetical protein